MDLCEPTFLVETALLAREVPRYHLAKKKRVLAGKAFLARTQSWRLGCPTFLVELIVFFLTV